ncbi:MAG: inosine/xanthosine triphosphatase [Holophagales bacterium]|nr:inosine/xanthosine triphosphatase [Holophagales bacterium]
MSKTEAAEAPDRLRLVVASQNPVKGEAARRGFARAFPGTQLEVATVSVPSGVADQPSSDAETLRGAANRARAAEQSTPGAFYWIGMEGGIAELGEEGEGGLMAFAWIVIRGRQPGEGGRKIREGRARTAAFSLPPPVIELIRQGLELGEADDRVFGRTDSKKNQGAVGLLTSGLLDRADLYEPAVILALVPFLRPELY